MQPPTTDEVTEALDLHSLNMPSSRSRDSASLSSSSVRTEKVSTALGGMTSPSSIPIDGVGDPEKAVVDPSLQRVSSPNKGDMPWTIKGNDWNGQDDPDNPHNWTLANRIYHTIMPALFSFVV